MDTAEQETSLIWITIQSSVIPTMNVTKVILPRILALEQKRTWITIQTSSIRTIRTTSLRNKAIT